MTSEQLQEAGPRPDLSQVMNHEEEPQREGDYTICKTVLFHCLVSCLLGICTQTKKATTQFNNFHFILCSVGHVTVLDERLFCAL